MRAYEELRADILSAALPPERRLRLDALSAQYGIGTIPLREALNRLVTEGFVEHRERRGFVVSSLPLADLEELVRTRIWLETRALEEAIANGDEAWEQRLIVAFHRLSRTQRLIEEQGEERLNAEWEALHRDFHVALIEPCGSSILVGFCATLMDQAVRYRNLSVNFTKARRGDAIEEHRAILDAALDRDGATASALLAAHYRKTLDGLRVLLG